ncbi:unnamed protein product [Mytilus coruscus]|uniref:B box-type domain-containing protein n=1 Tax=Mytilus coruscus TaxID=42192 RepID=A0A6J8C2X0_MYTCO|nr:unnamed protein product [Mytilus coruscus]
MTTEDKEFICGPCDYLQTPKTAVVWCPTCEEGLCHDCSVHHIAGKLTRDHKPINIDHYKEMPRKMIEEVKKCLKHDEIYELYCQNHKTHCCVQCVKEIHARCTGVTLLRQVIENIKTSAMVTEIMQELENRMGGLVKLTENRKKNVDRIDKQSSNLCTEFRRMRKAIESVLDEFESALNEEATSVKNTQSSKVNNSIDKIGAQKSVYKELHSNLQKVIAYGNNLQVYLAVKTIEEKLNRGDKELESLLKTASGFQEINVAFECNEHLSSLLTKNVKPGMVRTSCSPLKCEFKTPHGKEAQISSTNTGTTVSKLKIKTYVQTFQAHLSLSLDSSKTNISSIVPLPSGQTVITDYGGQQGVMLFHRNGSFNTRFNNLGSPYGACLIGDSVLAVSFPCNNNIKLLEIVESTCSILNIFRIKQSCYGLSFNSAGNIVAASAEPDNGIIVVGLNGQILKRVNLNLPMIRNVHCYRDKIIVTEFESTEILVFDPEGRKVITHTFNWEPDTRNICVDKHGNIFVCALNTEKVTVIPNDGNIRVDVLEPDDRLHIPKAIAYDKRTNTIAVAGRDGLFSAIYDIFYN